MAGTVTRAIGTGKVSRAPEDALPAPRVEAAPGARSWEAPLTMEEIDTARKYLPPREFRYLTDLIADRAEYAERRPNDEHAELKASLKFGPKIRGLYVLAEELKKISEKKRMIEAAVRKEGVELSRVNSVEDAVNKTFSPEKPRAASAPK